jgi:hypothetical protein
MSKKFVIPKHIYWYLVNEIQMRATYQAKVDDMAEEIETLKNVRITNISNGGGGSLYAKGDPAQAAALRAVELEADLERYERRLAKINRAREQFSGELRIIFDRRFWDEERDTHDNIMDELNMADRNKYFEMWDQVQYRTAFILCPWP